MWGLCSEHTTIIHIKSRQTTVKTKIWCFIYCRWTFFLSGVEAESPGRSCVWQPPDMGMWFNISDVFVTLRWCVVSCDTLVQLCCEILKSSIVCKKRWYVPKSERPILVNTDVSHPSTSVTRLPNLRDCRVTSSKRLPVPSHFSSPDVCHFIFRGGNSGCHRVGNESLVTLVWFFISLVAWVSWPHS